MNADNILYMVTDTKYWQVLIDEKVCESYDVNNDFVICWVVNEGLYRKRLPIGK